MNADAGSIRVFGAEKSFEIGQEAMAEAVDLNTAAKIFSLDLPEHGPYRIDYTRNGQYLALCGARGHLSIIRWKDFRLVSETYFARDSDYVHAVKFAMNESMLCVAQREGVYVYNARCVETHVLRRSMPFKLALEYLPYHFLLCGIGQRGKLTYLDVSMGKKVCTKDTALGRCDVLAQNPRNAVLHAGHANGCVTLWTPTNERSVARMLCHKHAVRSLAVDNAGRTMATADAAGYVKVWDLRMFAEAMTAYKANAACANLDFSHKGLLAFSTGRTAVVWNLRSDYRPCKARGAAELRPRHRRLYLQHTMDRRLVSALKFCPYEDALGIGTDRGFASMVVPGAGEPNYDLFEADPFESVKARKHRVVHQLLDKLQPDMIQLEPGFIAETARFRREVVTKNRAATAKADKKWGRKAQTKGKNGYRGVMRKRYSKYHHMKDLHVRQKRLRQLLNARKKAKSSARKEHALAQRAKVAKHLTRERTATPDALQRFKAKREVSNHTAFKSAWRKRAKKIHF